MNTKHTPGPWRFGSDDSTDYMRVYAGDLIVAGSIIEADAQLIAEAGTVSSECGLSPRELLEQRNDFLAAIENALAANPYGVRINGLWGDWRDMAEAAIKQARGEV